MIFDNDGEVETGVIFVKDLKAIVLGGFIIVGVTLASYRAYELKKLRDSMQNETIIEIEPDKVEVSRK